MIKFYNKTDEDAQIDIYGEIGESFWGESKSASDFKKELNNLGEVKNIFININSPGGSVFDGLAMYNILKRHKAKVIVYVDGLAASAASFVAMAADEVIMPENSYLMIHNAWSYAGGDKNELRKMADTLEQMDETISNIYAEKTGKEKEEILKMMDEETWINGKEALEIGFADKNEEEKKIAANIGSFFMSKFKNIPNDLNIIEDEKEGKNTDEHREEPEILEPVSIEQKLQEQQEKFNKIKLKILGGI